MADKTIPMVAGDKSIIQVVVHDNGNDTYSFGVVSTGNPTLATASTTIASGASLSGAVDLASAALIRLVLPAAWTTAVITVQSSFDGVTYNNLYDSYGTEYTIQAAASRSIVLVPADFLGMRYLKFRSGTAAAAVVQAADRILTLLTRPVA